MKNENENVNKTTTSPADDFNMRRYVVERIAVLEAAIRGCHTLATRVGYIIERRSAEAHPAMEDASRLELELGGALRLAADIGDEVAADMPLSL